MRWSAIPALLTCSLNSMLASIVLCLATYHVLTDKGTNPPIEPKEQWIQLVKLLIPFSVFWMILSLVGIYVSMSKKQMYTTMVLTFYVLCCGGSIYFTIGFGNQLEVNNMKPEDLYTATLQEIRAQSKDGWIPAWLEKFQKNSKFCCGINTYRDYEELWPTSPNRLPRSCCKIDPTPQACPLDNTLIPYPDTPDVYFKVETGCADEVLGALRHVIRETHHNCITMTVFIGCGVVTYLILYATLYLSEEVSGSQGRAILLVGGGDTTGLDDSVTNTNNILDKSSEPINVNSSGVCAGSLDSIEMKPLEAIESAEDPIGSAQMQSTVKQGPLAPALVSSSTKMKNVVIAGLEQNKIQKLEQIVRELQQQAEQLQQRQQQQQQFQHPVQLQSSSSHLELVKSQTLLEPEPQSLLLQSALFQQLQQAQQLQQQQIQRLQQLQQQQQQVRESPVLGANAETTNRGMYDLEDEMTAQANQNLPRHHKKKATGSPRTASNEDIVESSGTEQQNDEVRHSSPVGSPRGRLKKVRREAFRNTKK